MEKKSMFRVKVTRVEVTGVERTKIEIENTSTKECFCGEVNRPQKDVLRLLGVIWLGGEYTTDVDDIGNFVVNLRRDQKLEDFCRQVELWPGVTGKPGEDG